MSSDTEQVAEHDINVYGSGYTDGDKFEGLTRKVGFDRMIPPHALEVAFNKTTHVIFPSEIVYVDLGDENLVAGLADGAKNVLVRSLLFARFGLLLAGVSLALYLADIVLSVRSAIRVSLSVQKLHALQAELEAKLEQLRGEVQRAEAAGRQRMEEAVTAAVEQAGERRAEAAKALRDRLDTAETELAQRLEAARAEAQERFQVHYKRLDFFDRRLVRSFPSLRSTRPGDALDKLRAYLSSRR